MSRKIKPSQFVDPKGAFCESPVAPNRELLGFKAGTPTASQSGWEVMAQNWDTTNGAVYYNTGSITSATWTRFDPGAATITTATLTTATVVTLTVSAAASTPVAISNGDGSTALTPKAQVLGANKGASSLLLGCFSATATTVATPSLNFLKSANATIGSNTVIASGEVLGEINFFGADGTDFNSAACRIAGIVDTTPGTGDMPGRLVFSTSIDAGETLTAALTIDNNQVVRPAKGLVVTTGTAAAITTTRSLTAADSGGTFSVAKTSAYAITLPAAAAGLKFKFMVLDAGANAVTISSGAAHQFGDVSVNNVNTVLSAITTATLVATGDIGDWICFEGIDSTHYLVTGACKTAAKMTFA